MAREEAENLAPCKFCGHPHIELEHDPVCFLGRRKDGVDASAGYRVRCTKCACQTCWWHDRDEAVAKWNASAPNEDEFRRGHAAGVAAVKTPAPEAEKPATEPADEAEKPA